MIDVSPSLALLVLVGVLVGSGVTLVLERSLSRIVIGASLITYGVNVLVLMAGGRAGGPPILGLSEVSEMSDPLPQAMVLTAIVIGLALTAFMLAMSYRTWQLNGNDEVQDDREDRRIALDAARDTIAERRADDSGETLEEQADLVFDETEDEPSEDSADDDSETDADADDETTEDEMTEDDASTPLEAGDEVPADDPLAARHLDVDVPGEGPHEARDAPEPVNPPKPDGEGGAR